MNRIFPSSTASYLHHYYSTNDTTDQIASSQFKSLNTITTLILNHPTLSHGLDDIWMDISEIDQALLLHLILISLSIIIISLAVLLRYFT